ncbi:MAG: phage/plasmid primase, P4 family [Propionibacteriaceae bacterium]|nr:phage/plasmid primase, P4 family [Propionibacteriaceae bacterium]
MSAAWSTDASAYDEDGRPVSTGGESHSGQVRMAYRLANSHRDKLLHVHGIGWHYWDGKRWAEDEAGVANRAVLEVLHDALIESMNGDKTLRSDVGRCESASGINGVLSIASSLVEFATTIADLDADPSLLNCANGTLDLRTRKLRRADPNDRMTRVTRGAYDPEADTTEWETFLAQVLPDAEERAYLRRVIGQALYGRVTEHILPILIGTGANGKGTAYGAIINAVGDYGTVVDPSLLMVRQHGGNATTELMELLGARIVIGSETEEGRKLDEAVMKRLTGGDTLSARRLYRDPVTWTPSHTLLYVTNHLPQVRANDPAVWRRVRVVPFDVVVPPEQRDPDLPTRLELHADAILSWAIAGYFDYADNGGMREPSSVLRATDEYKAQSDAVLRFITEGCMVSPVATATTRQLYGQWQKWAINDGADPMSEKAFGAELDRLGYPAHRTKRGMTRRGIGVYDEAEGEGW